MHKQASIVAGVLAGSAGVCSALGDNWLLNRVYSPWAGGANQPQIQAHDIPVYNGGYANYEVPHNFDARANEYAHARDGPLAIEIAEPSPLAYQNRPLGYEAEPLAYRSDPLGYEELGGADRDMAVVGVQESMEIDPATDSLIIETQELLIPRAELEAAEAQSIASQLAESRDAEYMEVNRQLAESRGAEYMELNRQLAESRDAESRSLARELAEARSREHTASEQRVAAAGTAEARSLSAGSVVGGSVAAGSVPVGRVEDEPRVTSEYGQEGCSFSVDGSVMNPDTDYVVNVQDDGMVTIDIGAMKDDTTDGILFNRQQGSSGQRHVAFKIDPACDPHHPDAKAFVDQEKRTLNVLIPYQNNRL